MPVAFTQDHQLRRETFYSGLQVQRQIASELSLQTKMYNNPTVLLLSKLASRFKQLRDKISVYWMYIVIGKQANVKINHVESTFKKLVNKYLVITSNSNVIHMITWIKKADIFNWCLPEVASFRGY